MTHFLMSFVGSLLKLKFEWVFTYLAYINDVSPLNLNTDICVSTDNTSLTNSFFYYPWILLNNSDQFPFCYCQYYFLLFPDFDKILKVRVDLNFLTMDYTDSLGTFSTPVLQCVQWYQCPHHARWLNHSVIDPSLASKPGTLQALNF